MLPSEDPSVTTTKVDLLRSATVGKTTGLRDVAVVDVPHHLALPHCTLLVGEATRKLTWPDVKLVELRTE